MNYIGRQPAEKLAAMVASKNSVTDESLWYTDTGASHHVTSELGHLQIATPYHGSDSVQIGNGDTLPISNVGSFMCLAGDTTFSMHKLLHCPKASFNLLSVKRFARDNCCVFQFDDDGFLIKDKISGKTLHQSHAEGDMNPISFTALATSPPRACISKKNSTKLWHHRLGHPSSNILSIILHQLQLPSSSLESICSSCQQGNSCRLPFTSAVPSTTGVLQLLHCDLWGPSPILSLVGFKYYVLLIDDFTRYSWMFPIKLKSDFYHVFVNFCTLVENQFNTSIKMIRTDGGGEFSTKLLAKFLQAKGILHQKTCPYTPEQNGIVERKHRHLVETGLTLLTQSKLLLSLWLEPFTTAVFLIN